MGQETPESLATQPQVEKKVKPRFCHLAKNTALFSGSFGLRETELVGVVEEPVTAVYLDKRRGPGSMSFQIKRVEDPKKRGKIRGRGGEDEENNYFWVTKSTRGKGFIKYRSDNPEHP